MKKTLFSKTLSLFILGTLFPGFVFAKIPNDPKATQWAFKDIGAYSAWDLSTGSRDVVVAIIDNGFDATHPDLKDNVWKNADEIPNNNIDDDKNGYIDDVEGWNFVPFDKNRDGKIKGDELDGNNNPVPDVSNLSAEEKEQGAFNHATLVAGLIGAVGNNKKNMAGISWKVSLMNIKVLGNSGAGDYTPLADAILYAVNNGADIINISAVGTGSSDLEDAIHFAHERGVVVVAAAGNNAEFLNDSPLYPACSDVQASLEDQEVLGVSAIDETHHLAEFSNYGSDCVDITAPGVHMGSLLRYDREQGLNKEYSDGWNGTSFATPLVSGAAALIKAAAPDWKAPQIYKALLKNTHKTPPKDEIGYKNAFGYGLLQVDKALQYTVDALPTAKDLKSLNLFDSGSGSLQILGTNKKITLSTQSFLRKVSLLKTFKNKGETQYLTVRPYQGSNQVTIYSSTWKKLSRWNLPKDANGKIFVDTFLNVETPQVIVVPSNPGTNPVLVFSLEGKKLASKVVPIRGNTVQAVNFFGNQKFVVISKETSKNFLQIFDVSFFKTQEFALPSLGSAFQIERGDLDGDKKQEYIILSQKGTNATISVVSDKAVSVSQFPLSNTVNAADIQIALADFDKDKRDDILTLEKNASEVLMWKSTGVILDHIKFNATANQTFALIPIIQ